MILTNPLIEKLKKDFENGFIDIKYLREAMKKSNAEQEQKKMMNEIVKGTENAHNMKYSELKQFGFLAKAVVTMITLEVNDASKALDLLERYMRDELTAGEVEKIIQGE